MNIAECPYCGYENKLNWKEDEELINYIDLCEHQCTRCNKIFIIHIEAEDEDEDEATFYTMKADCLNDGEHDWVVMGYCKEHAHMQCRACEDTRPPYPEELEKYWQE